MPATLTRHRLMHCCTVNSKSELSVVNITPIYREMNNHRDVSALISSIAPQYSFDFNNLAVNEVLVGDGIGIKAIAPCAINFKIMVTHGEVRLRSYLRLVEDCDLLTPSSAAMNIKASSLTHIVAGIITMESIKQISSLTLASFIYL